jgi:hypothetical protein
MWNTLPTYAQVKEFWTGYFNNVQKFYKDWAEDVKTSFKKQD